MFNYPVGRSGIDYIDEEFIPLFDLTFDTIEDENAANALCGDDRNCKFDYLLTHNDELAKGTSDTNAMEEETDKKIGNFT